MIRFAGAYLNAGLISGGLQTAGRCTGRGALDEEVLSPVQHQVGPLCEQVAAGVSRFGLITDDVGERRFGNFARVVGSLVRPVLESGTEAGPRASSA